MERDRVPWPVKVSGTPANIKRSPLFEKGCRGCRLLGAHRVGAEGAGCLDHTGCRLLLQCVRTSRRFHEFLGMGDGGALAAPMQVEIVEDETCDPTDEFIARGERKGTC